MDEFRFTFKQSKGAIFLDDVTVKCENNNPLFVKNYENVQVNTDSKKITGLKPNTNYYYRVRAESNNNTSANSNIIHVHTHTELFGELTVKVFPNPTRNQFNLLIKNIDVSDVHVIVTDINGKIVFHDYGSSDKNFVFGNNFKPGIYFVKVIQDNNEQTVKISKL